MSVGAWMGSRNRFERNSGHSLPETQHLPGRPAKRFYRKVSIPALNEVPNGQLPSLINAYR